MAIMSAQDYANSDEFKRLEAASKAYRDKQAGLLPSPPTPASTPQVAPQPNRSQGIIDGLMTRFNQPAQPFNFNPNRDAGFQAQKAMIAQDTTRDMAAAKVKAGAVGMRGGSLQNNQMGQISAYNQSRLQNEALPAAMTRAYQQYADQQRAEQLQASNLMGMADMMDRKDQNQFSNDLALRQETRLNDLDAYNQKRNRIGDAQWGINTYGFGEAKEDPGVFFDQYKSVVPLSIQQLMGNVNGQRTLQGQQVDDSMLTSALNRTLAESGATGMYNGAPTLSREQMTSNQDAENRRIGLQASGQAQSVANATASQGLAQDRFAWEKDPNNPDNLYKMAQSGKQQQPVQIPAKESTDNYSMILEDLGTAGITKQQAMQLAQANQEFLSDSDYRKLIDYINKEF